MQEKFEEFYNYYQEDINMYYNELKANMKKYIIQSLLISLLLSCVFVISTYTLISYNLNIFKLDILPCIAFTVVMLGTAFVRLKNDRIKKNEKIILDIIKYISKDSSAVYYKDKRINQKHIEEMELFNLNNLKYGGENYISAKYNNNNMNFADMDIYYYKDKIDEKTVYDENGREYIKKITRKVKKTVFSGCYISATLNKKISDHIYLIPNNLEDLFINGKLNDYITYSGNLIELENLEFSKKYKVYSENEFQARYILTLNLMEKINNIDKIFDNKKYIVFKEGRRFTICIENFKIENIRKATLPLLYNSKNKKENLKYIFENIFNLFEIYNILDLGNDVYVK